ncbi:MAG TPA: serine/threonine-protein kinase [Acidimicrobiales bacterium]|nr:serine/threonine-protein kinase [Acidimicrobiales bacterium]
MGPERRAGPGTAALPERIGRYRVEEVLGTGAFSTVYRAVDERLEDVVAVKVLAENHSLALDLRERFLAEGRVLRRIASRHVVTVHDLGETGRQQPYLVLEHADRGTLGRRVPDLLARGWRAGLADVWAVAGPLAEALAAVHRAGVVHRDLSPGNVLLTTRGAWAEGGPATVTAWDERLVLADLGLCKDLALNSGHTSAGGTEGFRPPELRRGPAVIDGRADLWSLSALVVWLATGRPPGDVPARVALAGTGFPEGLARALDRSLAHDPAARHPDPHAWWADVATALGGPGWPRAGTPTPWPVPVATAPWPAPSPAPGASAPPSVTAPPFAPLPGSPEPAVAAGAAPGGPAWRGAPPVGGPEVTGPPARARPWTWRLRHSAWMLAALPLGLTTWAGFLYIALRSGRRAWGWAAGAYGVAVIAVLVLAATSPVGADGRSDAGSWQSTLGAAVLVATWLVGCAHALIANRRWLGWRSRGP